MRVIAREGRHGVLTLLFGFDVPGLEVLLKEVLIGTIRTSSRCVVGINRCSIELPSLGQESMVLPRSVKVHHDILGLGEGEARSGSSHFTRTR